MGDRGNIVVLDGTNGVWLYSHWGGHRLEATTRKVMQGPGRIGDPDYLTRIIFCNMIADGFRDMDTGEMGRDLIEREMVKTAENPVERALFLAGVVDEFLSTTGAGIGTSGVGDQQHPTVCVDAITGEVWTDPSRPTTTAQVIRNREQVNA